MKKITVVILMLVSIVLSFVGCTEPNDGFELVCSIEYTTSGKTKVENSTYKIITKDGVEETTKEEYLCAKEEYKVSGTSLNTRKMNKERKVIDSKDKEGKIFYYCEPKGSWTLTTGKPDYYYFKYEFVGYQYNYLYIKIIDDETIVIRNNDGDTTYKVTSYRITYFD